MDAEEFIAAVKRYERLLFYIAYSILRRREDCADAVQEAILKAWASRGKLRDGRQIKPWLTRILVNTCFTMRRGEKPVCGLDERLPALTVDNLPLHDALERLPDNLRLPLVLHYLEGFSVREIARIMEAPQGSVKTWMLRGRRELEQMLGEKEMKP